MVLKIRKEGNEKEKKKESEKMKRSGGIVRKSEKDGKTECSPAKFPSLQSLSGDRMFYEFYVVCYDSSLEKINLIAFFA